MRSTSSSQTNFASLRRTIYRKINKWLPTEDFQTWLKHAWLEKYQKVDNVEAFRGLTRLLGYVMGKQPNLVEDLNEIVLKWQQNDVNSNNTIQTA
jgi:hypothetical protein